MKLSKHPDWEYLSIAKMILENGEEREDRTGTGTISLFSPPPMRFDLTKRFPLLTTKKLHIPSIVHELLWFIKGSTNIKYLNDNNVHIWDEWADEYGNLGPIYGKQWRKWDSPHQAKFVDQIKELIYSIKTNPTSRRHIVSAWNVSDLPYMALPPCHILFQVYVHNDGGLSLQLYQRSADFFLGVPFNIASYSLLTHMIAQVAGLYVYAKEFIHVIGDAHIYKNHIEQIKTQLKREPRELPKLVLNPFIKDIDDFTYNDIKFFGYNPHPAIKGEVSV